MYNPASPHRLRFFSFPLILLGDETFSQHEVEVFLDTVREDQQQPEKPEHGSSPEKEAGSPTVSVEEELSNHRDDVNRDAESKPTVSVEEKESNHQGDANRDPESNDAGPAIEFQRGEGDRERGEKSGSGGSSKDGEWGGADRGFRPAWLVVLTFVHEAWLCLQHANVLLNPLCQRLDRGYGVALVSKEYASFLGYLEDFVVGFRQSCDLHTFVCVVRMAACGVALYTLVGERDQISIRVVLSRDHGRQPDGGPFASTSKPMHPACDRNSEVRQPSS